MFAKTKQTNTKRPEYHMDKIYSFNRSIMKNQFINSIQIQTTNKSLKIIKIKQAHINGCTKKNLYLDLKKRTKSISVKYFFIISTNCLYIYMEKENYSALYAGCRQSHVGREARKITSYFNKFIYLVVPLSGL